MFPGWITMLGSDSLYQMQNSLLFRGSQYLTRTPSIAGNRQKFTVSAWVREVSTTGVLLEAYQDTNNWTLIGQHSGVASGDLQIVFKAGGSLYGGYTAALFRDYTGYAHICVAVDTTDATASDRIRLYVNGVRVTLTMNTAWPTQNLQTTVNNTVQQWLARSTTLSNYWQGYIAELILVDGAALIPSYFGEIDPITGSWRPKNPSVSTYGTNGFYLGKPFDATDLGNDASGQGNNWTPVSFAASDVVGDSPTNVFATLNPLAMGSALGLSGGNLAPTSAGSWGSTLGTLRMTTGKWFWAAANMVTNGNLLRLGIANGTYAGVPANLGTYAGNDANSWIVQGNGTAQIRSQYNAAYLLSGTVPVTLVDADYFVCAFDADTKKLWLGVHDISASTTYWMDGAGTLRTTNEPALGTNQTYMVTGTEWFPVAACAATGMACDFGQKSFGGVTPPDGFKALCTANLPSTTGQTSGTFTGNANADGPCVYTGAVPETLTINSNSVTWGTHADKLATGFKLRTSSSSYNSTGTNSWIATYSTPQKPTVGSNQVPANAQGNP